MSHQSNKAFNAVIDHLGWSLQRGAHALNVGEDDMMAWREGRRPVPERVLDIMNKYKDIYEGRSPSGSRKKPSNDAHKETHHRAQDHLKKEKIHILRDAYIELAREYARLAALVPGGQDTSFGPYAVLGILPHTPWKEVKIQYHKLSKAHHPDRGGDEEVMKQISMAYTTLRLIYGM
jgi:preprotein translocase subunit Sec63